MHSFLFSTEVMPVGIKTTFFDARPVAAPLSVTIDSSVGLYWLLY